MNWMKRLAASVTAAAALMAMTVAPAEAERFRKTDCWNHTDSAAYVCIDLHGTEQDDGRGIHITGVSIRCGPLSVYEDGQAVDGDNLILFNHRGDRVWSRGDAKSNIDGGDCYKGWNTDVRMPRATKASLGYAFWPRLDNRRDPGWRIVNVTVYAG